jgi:hypothetical protein
MRTAMARFPFVKPLETFDFGYQPSIDRKQVQQLASCRGNSYRLKDKLKAGLVRSHDDNSSQPGGEI